MMDIEMMEIESLFAVEPQTPTTLSDILPDQLLCGRKRKATHETHTTKQQKQKLELTAGAFYIPKDDETKPNGDDAYFICAEKQTLGVADGVGGWSKRGVDAGVYARELMANSSESALMVPLDSLFDPRKILVEAHSKTKAKGSSTACIITLQHNYLCAANLGDSGFAVLREGKIVYKSPVLQHKFNFPYQLGNGKQFDSPRAAMQIKVPVKPGDIIVAGTDGLFDNMFNQQLEEIVKNEEIEGSRPEHIAWYIAENALYNSLDKYSETPFSTASKAAGGKHQGGKIDDITVVVAFIQPSD